jgi:hypothetical protein
MLPSLLFSRRHSCCCCLAAAGNLCIALGDVVLMLGDEAEEGEEPELHPVTGQPVGAWLRMLRLHTIMPQQPCLLLAEAPLGLVTCLYIEAESKTPMMQARGPSFQDSWLPCRPR